MTSLPDSGATRSHTTGARTDVALAAAFLDGDTAAFEAIYDRYAATVRQQCARALGNGADADEAVQRTFTRLLTRLPALADTSNLLAYLRTTARWACQDVRTARGTVAATGGHERASKLADPIDVAHAVEREMSARIVLADLTPAQASLLHDRYLADMPVAQMASERGSTSASVHVMLTRARSAARRAAESRGIRSLAPVTLATRWRQSFERWAADAAPLLQGSSMVAAVAVVALGAAALPSLSSTPADDNTHHVASSLGTDDATLAGTGAFDREAAGARPPRADAATRGAASMAAAQPAGTDPLDGDAQGGPRRVGPVATELADGSGGFDTSLVVAGEESAINDDEPTEPTYTYDLYLGDQAPVAVESDAETPDDEVSHDACSSLRDGAVVRCSEG